MTDKMLVETDLHQTRVAVLEDDRLAELYVERNERQGVVGNVYKGRVNRVLPGMQAAFVDVGLDRDAFLYVSDVRDDLGDLGLEDDLGEGEEEEGETPSIEDLLRPGQEVLVQVVRDPVPDKGARVTTHVSLPGRFLVLLPTGSQRGVSRRIESEEERERLRTVLADLDERGGLIVRTAGEGRSLDDFRQDLERLRGMWNAIRRRGREVGAPGLVHRDLDLALRLVRDVFGPGFSELWVDGEEERDAIVELLGRFQPGLVDRVRLADREGSLFEGFGIDSAIEEALRPKVWLRSGGYIVINPTEALVAIDVNTGRFVGRSRLEETILKTNLEAVREIARQIRLRNLGGIIVLDLIDMEDPEHRDRVFGALEEALERDRSRTKVLSISEFGLVEITRKRTRPSLERLLTTPCPYCGGRGRIKSVTTVVLALRRKILRQGVSAGTRRLVVKVHPDVARALREEERAVLEELEEELELTVSLESSSTFHHERFDVLEA